MPDSLARSVRGKTSRFPEGDMGCLPWLGALKPPHGRATVWDPRVRRAVQVPRVVWQLEHGFAPPPWLMVMHVCDVPMCVRGRHLVLGSQAANAQDAARKGRTGLGVWGSRLPVEEQAGFRYRVALQIRAAHRVLNGYGLGGGGAVGG